jgi:hypothetical protein
METMKTFSDPGELSPLDIDTRTGLPRTPNLNYTVSDGIAYVARGEDLYLLRRAQDCGPDENRTEEIYLGRRPDVAEGTWAFYGMIRRGSVSGGSFGDGEIGGYITVPGIFGIPASGFVGDPSNPDASSLSVAQAVADALGGDGQNNGGQTSLP